MKVSNECVYGAYSNTFCCKSNWEMFLQLSLIIRQLLNRLYMKTERRLLIYINRDSVQCSYEVFYQRSDQEFFFIFSTFSFSNTLFMYQLDISPCSPSLN